MRNVFFYRTNLVLNLAFICHLSCLVPSFPPIFLSFISFFFCFRENGRELIPKIPYIGVPNISAFHHASENIGVVILMILCMASQILFFVQPLICDLLFIVTELIPKNPYIGVPDISAFLHHASENIGLVINFNFIQPLICYLLFNVTWRRWMNSHMSLSRLNGFFLRLRLWNWEKGLGGAGYYVACINGTSTT